MMALLDQVDAALAGHVEPSAVLAALRSTAPLGPLLGLFRADASRLEALANRSYRHHNGFDKIVLASPAGSPLKLVLHVWPRGGLDSADHIHNHRWDFASVVLCGALRLEVYEQDVHGGNHSAMRYRPLPGVGNYELHANGTMAVSPRASFTMARGSTYTWASELLHRAWGLPGQLTATLIVQGPPTRGSTTVLMPEQGAQSPPNVRQDLYRLREDEVARTLATLAESNVQAAWDLDGHQPLALPR